jgi:ABC-type Zn uptake system ZnuABC Zn-binding protein ZnuA
MNNRETVRGVFKPLFRCTIALLVLFAPAISHAKPIVVATVPALGELARAVGGNHIDVHVLTRSGQNPYVFFPRPSHVDIMEKADLLFAAGYGLEGQWLPSLILLGENPKVVPGATGYFTGEQAIQTVGTMRGMTSKSLKKWSPDENPFWWLDPNNGIKAAALLAIRLGEIDPVHEMDYVNAARALRSDILKALPEWRLRMKSLKGPVLTYHNTYDYFIKAMDVELAGYIEPLAGIEPSTRHLSNLIEKNSNQGIAMIWVEPYHEGAIAKRLAKETGIRLISIPDATAGTGSNGYIDMFNKIVLKIERWSQ